MHWQGAPERREEASGEPSAPPAERALLGPRMRGSRTERCGRAPALAYLGEGGARARDRDCSFSSSIGGAAASAPTERFREPAFLRWLDLFLIALRFDSALESKTLLWQNFLPYVCPPNHEGTSGLNGGESSLREAEQFGQGHTDDYKMRGTR